MTLDLQTVEAITKIVSGLVVAIIAIVRATKNNKPKLISYLVHSTGFQLPQQNGQAQTPDVHTHCIVVRNIGKQPAKNVRIGHHQLPLYRIDPPVSFTVANGQGNSSELVFPNLAPGEQVTVSYLYFHPTLWSQIVAYVKSDEVLAKNIRVIPTIPPAPWIRGILWTLVAIGAATVLYWPIRTAILWVFFPQGL